MFHTPPQTVCGAFLVSLSKSELLRKNSVAMCECSVCCVCVHVLVFSHAGPHLTAGEIQAKFLAQENNTKVS